MELHGHLLAQAQKALYTRSGLGTGAAEPPKVDENDGGLAPEVGDLVQWEASGVLRMEAPRRVRAKQEHDGAWWVFVEGSETGIPMEEAVVIERKAAGDPQNTPLKQAPRQPPSLPLSPLYWEVPYQPSPDEREWLRGPLSRDVSYRLLVTGDFGPKQIGKLIKLLTAQQAVLAEEDEPPED